MHCNTCTSLYTYEYRSVRQIWQNVNVEIYVHLICWQSYVTYHNIKFRLINAVFHEEKLTFRCGMICQHLWLRKVRRLLLQIAGQHHPDNSLFQYLVILCDSLYYSKHESDDPNILAMWCEVTMASSSWVIMPKIQNKCTQF